MTLTSTNPKLLEVVQSRKVFGACDSGGANLASWQTHSGYENGRAVTVFGRRIRWAAGARSATVTLPADISQDVDCRRCRTAIDHATNISDVTATGPIYIVGAGTPGATLELAELDSCGVLHTLTMQIGGQPDISADPRGRV